MKTIFKSNFFNGHNDRKYFITISTSQVTEYLGWEGLKLANPLKNWTTTECFPIGKLSMNLWTLDIADIYVFSILYDFPFWKWIDKNILYNEY